MVISGIGINMFKKLLLSLLLCLVSFSSFAVSEIKVNDAGTWRELSEIKVNDSGVWRTITVIYVNDSGVWRVVYDKIAPTIAGSVNAIFVGSGTLRVTWSPSTDAESGMTGQVVSACTPSPCNPFSGIYTAFVSAATASYDLATPTTSGVTYCAGVQGIDKAGNESFSSSSCTTHP
jgi:hypothetical protein